MAILVNQSTRVLVQGITGKEGARATKEMLTYGTQVLAGVRPGKAGEQVHGVPVFNTVADALVAHPTINASLIVVPASAVPIAAAEAIDADIPLVVILTEHVPVGESARIVARARRTRVRVVGPSSVGIISPSKGKIGAIGSGDISEVFKSGRVGIISKSGGMTAEIAVTLARSGFGVSTAIGIGGDAIIGTDIVDALRCFRDDENTDSVVVFGEIGGTYEEKAAAYVAGGAFTKPIVAIIAGRFTESLSQGTALGHAGAIVAKGQGSHQSKVAALKASGIRVADRLEEIPILLQQLIYEQSANQRIRT